jgi:hypothetical protein
MSENPETLQHTLSGWGGDENPAPLTDEQAARLQEHDEPVGAAQFGAALAGDLGQAEVADESADAPETVEPDVSLGHEAGRRYAEYGGQPSE